MKTKKPLSEKIAYIDPLHIWVGDKGQPVLRVEFVAEAVEELKQEFLGIWSKCIDNDSWVDIDIETLRVIDKIFGSFNHSPSVCRGRKMKELKTLKDLDIEPVYIGPVSTSCVRIDELKQEAIKWIQNLDKNNRFFYYKDWIKYFFNLTEEDLKGGKKKNGRSN